MNAEILAVGTELLMGQIANTNAQYISGRLNDIGVNVYYHTVVGDNADRLKECLDTALKRSDIVIMTGGLGPTMDDMTKETVSEIFGLKLVLHKESLDKIEGFYKKLGRPMAENNKKQAYLPEGCIIVENNNGTAPGCIIEKGRKIVTMLPGPPREMKPKLEETVIPFLESKSDSRIASRYLRLFGIGESSMEEKIIDLVEKQINPTVAPYAKEGEVTLRITAKCGRSEDADRLIDPLVKEIQNRLGDFIYSYTGSSMEETVGKLLIEKNITIACAESCTGGMISERLTSVPGISAVFNRAIVSYSNESKMENLGVRRKTIENYGAVSKETAVEMAEGVKRMTGTGLGLSVTGIAGPGGGTAEKPVGLVYVALSSDKGTEYKELRLWGDRERIRNVTVLHALDMVRRHLLGATA